MWDRTVLPSTRREKKSVGAWQYHESAAEDAEDIGKASPVRRAASRPDPRPGRRAGHRVGAVNGGLTA